MKRTRFVWILFLLLGLAACNQETTLPIVQEGATASRLSAELTPKTQPLKGPISVPSFGNIDHETTLSSTPRPAQRWTPTPTSLEQGIAEKLTAMAYSFQTFTPTSTFDIRSIQTTTPMPPATCPPNHTNQVPTPEYNNQFYLGIYDHVFLDYLNQFGSDAFRQADQITRDEDGRLRPNILLYRDLTNDGVPEIVVSRGPLYILGCKDGKYQTIFTSEMSAHGTRQTIQYLSDLNKNGIPELMIMTDIGTQADSYYRLLEWKEDHFVDLLKIFGAGISGEEQHMWVLAGGKIRYQDINQDGLIDIVLYQGSPLSADYFGSAPWRRYTQYFQWNGQNYTITDQFFDPPQYRFQAVEDADHAVMALDYDQAIDLYQQVIFNDRLEWWTIERRDYIFQEKSQELSPLTMTPPAPDPNEYSYLSAYARFRIMVVHLLRGYDSDAQVVYQTLIDLFPEGTPGSIYAQMAEVFWKNYSVTHSASAACGEARAVAIWHEQEATQYFMDDYKHLGYPKENYTVQMLCPFQ